MARTTEDQINEFKDFLPLIEILCNPGLRLRHWQKVNNNNKQTSKQIRKFSSCIPK